MERSIRNEVFIVEQTVPPELEFENEEGSTHYLLLTHNGAVGCARYRWVGHDIKLERIAVKRRERGKGYGRILVECLLNEVRPLRPRTIYLNSQTSVKGFYERFGFTAIGKVFLEAGIEHIKMVLEQEEKGL